MVTITLDEETGEEKKRLINRMRWKGYGPASIMFTDSAVCMVTSQGLVSPEILLNRSQKNLLLVFRKYKVKQTTIY